MLPAGHGTRNFVIALILFAIVMILVKEPTPIEYRPMIIIPEEPVIEKLKEEMQPIDLRGYKLIPLAKMHLRARVLHKKNYHAWEADAACDLSPTDLALGWGRMSDQSVVDKLEMDQGTRVFTWRTHGEPPIPAAEINTHSANMHFIPKNDAVADVLSDLRRGSLIEASGLLVEADRAGYPPWISSLTMYDTGNDSDEVFYVESLKDIFVTNTL